MWTNVTHATKDVTDYQFLTPDFWDQLRARVLQAFDEQIVSYGLRPAA